MGVTILYAIFKTGKKIGKLNHLAYVKAKNPHEALDMYLQEDGAQNPTSLIALPCSGNKFTMYQKSANQDLRRRDRLETLKRKYQQVSYYNTEVPCNHKPWSWQKHEQWCRQRGVEPRKNWQDATYQRIQRYA